MPELPEVETVRRGLESMISQPVTILRVEAPEKRLREPVRPGELRKLKGQSLQGFLRRAKYLLWETEHQMIVSHLGMTGSWRLLEGEHRRHDHVRIHLSDGRVLVYNDPRRFGIFRVLPIKKWQEAAYFTHLGPEPLDQNLFTTEYLFNKSRQRKVASKVFIMDQKVVVGVGNIYASEALFRSGVRPQRQAGRLTRVECERLVQSCRKVLQDALRSGGTTIRDFRQAGGGKGYFARQLQVYDRAGEACQACGAKISQRVLGGRSTYWCPKCQK